MQFEFPFWFVTVLLDSQLKEEARIVLKERSLHTSSTDELHLRFGSEIV